MRRNAGFTMVELMVAMLLGLVVIAAAGSMFVAGQQNFRNNAALAEVQDNIRVAFELMARDIREAGYWGCNSVAGTRIANVLGNGTVGPTGVNGTPGDDAWWGNTDIPLQGIDPGENTFPIAFDGSATPATESRAPATGGLITMGATGQALSVETMDASADVITLNEATADLQDADVIVVCDPSQASIVQITGYDTGARTAQYDGSGTIPGNCTTGLAFPTNCGAVNNHTFGGSSSVSRFGVSGWFIGFNGGESYDPVTEGTRPGRSLYRISLENDGAGALVPVPREIVRGVTDMQILYRSVGELDFTDATTRNSAANPTAAWADTEAVQVLLTLESDDRRVGTETRPVERTFTNVITLRNRVG